MERLDLLDVEVRLVSPTDNLDDYCDTICKLFECDYGESDRYRFDHCACYHGDGQRCLYNHHAL